MRRMHPPRPKQNHTHTREPTRRSCPGVVVETRGRGSKVASFWLVVICNLPSKKMQIPRGLTTCDTRVFPPFASLTELWRLLMFGYSFALRRNRTNNWRLRTPYGAMLSTCRHWRGKPLRKITKPTANVSIVSDASFFTRRWAWRHHMSFSTAI